MARIEADFRNFGTYGLTFCTRSVGPGASATLTAEDHGIARHLRFDRLCYLTHTAIGSFDATDRLGVASDPLPPFP